LSLLYSPDEIVRYSVLSKGHLYKVLYLSAVRKFNLILIGEEHF